MKRGDIVRYERPRGGSARGYWLDEARMVDTLLGPENQVKVMPIEPGRKNAIWVSVDAIYDEEREEA